MEMENANWQTRLNYSPRVRGAVTCGTFLMPAVALRLIDRGPAAALLPAIMHGRLSDTAALGAEMGLAKFVLGDNIDDKVLVQMSLGFQVISELIQAIPGTEETFLGGTFDVGDIGAFFVGAGLWGVYEMTAKFLHDSGATLMAYHALGITHKKFG
jgi:hypothetical protein